MHICIILVLLDIWTVTAIDNKRYGHFNAQKHETITQNIGGTGYSLCCPPNQIIGCTMSPVPPVSALMHPNLIT